MSTEKKINPESTASLKALVLGKKMDVTRTGRYKIRIFIVPIDNGLMLQDQFGVKMGEVPSMSFAEYEFKKLEIQGIRVMRYLHTAGQMDNMKSGRIQIGGSL
jgi:hypothetical protein